MKCIVGLGNPGKKYTQTRHNVGFMVMEELLKKHGWDLNKKKFNGKYTTQILYEEKLLLLAPQTYMNLSGEALRPIMEYYDINVNDIVIVYDDMDLPVGKIRLRQKGGHGGHNGIKSVINHIGTKDFKRIRVGIGKPKNQTSIIDYVLGTFDKQEKEEISTSIKKAVDACDAWMMKPFDEVMNEFNQ